MIHDRSGGNSRNVMMSSSCNPPILSRLASRSPWTRLGLGALSLIAALALATGSALAQQSSGSNKKAADSDDMDEALDVFTSADLGYTPTQPGPQGPSTLFPLPPGTPFSNFPSRIGYNFPTLLNPMFPTAGNFLPYSNGIPVAAIGPQGTPLTPPGSMNASNAYNSVDSFDILKQPSEFKYTGSEIGLLYGFSSSGASIRAAGFITSLASNTTQIYFGATFSDQSGLPFNPLFPNRKLKFSAQTQEYFGGLNYKLAGGSMIVGIDFAVQNTNLSGNFKSFNRVNQPVLAVSNPKNIGSGTTYGGQINLSGGLPGNAGAYQIGFGADQTNGLDPNGLMLLRRR